MRSQHWLKALYLATLGATKIAAMTHGEYDDYLGKVIRYHQLAEGVYTGVPADEWDDQVHRRSDEVWDLGELVRRGGGSDDDDATVVDLETRDLGGIGEKCTEVVTCAAVHGNKTIKAAYEAWLAAVEKAKPACTSLLEFLDRPFWATWFGVAIAGIISAHVNSASLNSCSALKSPLGTDAEVVRNVVAHAVAAHTDATDMSITVHGPSGEWTISIASTGAEMKPVPACRR
ncbi:hypothetical protein JDV02_009091 [Purpureocillium takamizusanense]|uniref:Uncharacterized protein n=1 Tax=Purpureocillium takamizusanense TaxID=2060973 RepID=A0A9Q8QLE0_9HYPO|nr:uncharacterized protein JDV02_009091 [Purpureocillium takamizusanense]UNI23259.1 hypothetical protein JDV02_009091 [Purpureocillium takamizusanense]